MKKLMFIGLLFILIGTSFGQYTSVEPLTRHGKQLSATFTIQSTGYDSILVQFAGSVDKEPTIAVIDTGETVATHWVTNKGNIIWNGYLRVQLVITNTDLATDSLQVLAYALDEDGNVISNDYTYCEFATPPSWDESVVTKSWTTAIKYVADLSGAFGEGTGGVLFILDINDETATHVGSANFKVISK